MIISDEKEYALKLLQDGYIRENKKLKDIFILAKYFKYIGKSQFQTSKEIIRFINKYDNFIYRELSRKLKQRAINTVKNAYNSNYTLRTGTIIELSEKEVLAIANLNTKGERQVLFALLVLSKFYNNGTGAFYVSYKDIFDCTKLSYQTNNIDGIFDKLVSNGIIEFINKYKVRQMVNTYSASLYRRNYIKLNIEKSNDIFYCINNIDNLEYDFIRCFKKIGIHYCEKCGVLMLVKSNRQKYCVNCAKIIHNKNKLASWHKNKSKYKNTRQIEKPIQS